MYRTMALLNSLHNIVFRLFCAKVICITFLAIEVYEYTNEYCRNETANILKCQIDAFREYLSAIKVLA